MACQALIVRLCYTLATVGAVLVADGEWRGSEKSKVRMTKSRRSTMEQQPLFRFSAHSVICIHTAPFFKKHNTLVP